MTPSPIVGASAHRWPMDLRTDALRNHHPRMPQYSKGQEAGKYDERTDVHSIDFSGYAVNHLLSEDYVEQFMRKLESFNVKLNVK